MVKAAAHHGGLGKARVDVPAQRFAGSKIHRRARHGQDAPGGAGLVVALQIPGRVELELLVQHIALTIQIKICMVGEVQHGVRVGGHPVVHPQGIVLREDIPHRNFQIAGEPVFSIRALRLQ